MLASLMEGKHLDFDAPLLSVRRFFSGPPPVTTSDRAKDSTSPPLPRPPLPFYKPDIKSGPVRNPGVVPFFWEQRPGKPKEEPGSDLPRRLPAPPKPPPPRAAAAKLGSSVRTRKPFQTFSDLIVARSPERSESGVKAVEEIKDDYSAPQSLVSVLDSCEDQAAGAAAVATAPAEQEAAAAEDEEEEEAFSDALDTLSRAESSFMNCSVSGLPEPAEPLRGLSADPQVLDFMMGRFLPAAQAVASESPQYNFRKIVAPKPDERVGLGDHRRPPFPRPYQHRPRYVQQYPRLPDYEEKEEDDDCGDNRHLATKGSGLLPQFCAKSSFCLLNPVPGMMPHGRAALSRGRRSASPMIRSSQGESLGQAKEGHS